MTYKEMEMLIVENRIKKLIEKDSTVTDIDDAIKKFGNFQIFKEKNNLANVFGRNNNPMNNDDYLKVLDKLKKFYDNQKQFNEENIKTTNIDDKNIITYKNGNNNVILDNSYSKKEVNEQLKDLQKTNSDFRTQNLNTNTNNMMKHMKEEKKEEIKPKLLKEININSLGEEEKKFYTTALLFQEQIHKPIKIDMYRKLIFDNDNNVYSMEKRDTGIIILPIKSNQKAESLNKKAVVKKLVKTPLNTGKNGFINAAILAFITGSFFGTLVINLFSKIIK